MTNIGLGEKEKWFDDYVQKHMIDVDGIVYSRINVDTDAPFSEDEIPSEFEYLKIAGFSTCEIMNYEDSGMTTGAYLAALTYKYLVTKDVSVLKRAEKVFDGICWIYELGKREKEGYYPKPYGKNLSDETSSDQYLYSMKGMMVYRQIASSEHIDKIGRMIPKMADFWIDGDYKRTYFGIKDMQWPIGRFPCFLIMAYVVSHDQKYLDEFNRLNEEFEVYKKPWESQIYNRRREYPDFFSNYEKSHGSKYVLGNTPECAVMDIMENDECLQHSDSYRDDWMRVIKIMFDEGKMLIADNGYAYMKMLYDPKTKEVEIPKPDFMIPPDNLEIDWSFEGWIGKVYMPRSTSFARVCVNVYKWLGLQEAKGLLLKILNDIQINKVVDYLPADENQLLEKHKFLTKQVCCHSICNWLWAYWQGRHEGVVDEFIY